jgi:hypothetical protein
MMIPQSTITGGVGGVGGTSAGNPGAVGLSSRAIGCALL